MTDNINPNFPRGVEVVVGVIIENPKGEILLVKSPKWGNKWTIPGGHVDAGESIVQAAVRESKEETGLDCKVLGIFTNGENINPSEFSRPAHFVYFGAYCQCGSEPLKLDGDELVDHIWETPEKALSYDFRRGFGNTIAKFIEFKKSAKISQNYSKT